MSKHRRIKLHSGSPDQSGFTLVELMIVLAVAAILITIAIPAMSSFLEKNNLKGAAEEIYSRINYGRSESIKSSSDVYVKFLATTNTSWSMGTGDTTGCIPTQAVGGANPCTLPASALDATKVLKTYVNDNTKFTDISMTAYSTADFTTTAVATPEIVFDSVRGTASPLYIKLVSSPNSWEIRITITTLGNVKMCSDSSAIGGYPSC